jgi:DNA replication protein DnaC
MADGRLSPSLGAMDAIIIDELGYLQFPASSGALLFQLISHQYKKCHDDHYQS